MNYGGSSTEVIWLSKACKMSGISPFIYREANGMLKELASRVPENSPFTKKYGRRLNLVTLNFEEDTIHVLFQFFDPKHHYFTFPDYQLVPTMEEFSQLLGVPILDQLPFTGI